MKGKNVYGSPRIKLQTSFGWLDISHFYGHSGRFYLLSSEFSMQGLPLTAEQVIQVCCDLPLAYQVRVAAILKNRNISTNIGAPDREYWYKKARQEAMQRKYSKRRV